MMNNLDLFDSWHDLKENNKNIDDFCNENKIILTREEKINLLIDLVKKNVFSYSTLLTNSLPIIADYDDQFISLLDNIVKAINGDLATGWFEMALIKIGEENHHLGIELAKKMRQIPSLFPISVIPIGGIGHSNYDEIENMVDEMFSSKEVKEIINGLVAIRISFANKEPNKRYNIFSKIEIVEKIRNEDVNAMITMVLLEFYKYDPIFCQQHLLELVRNNDGLKGLVSRHLWIHPLENSTKAIELLRECHDSINQNIRYSVLYALSHYVKTNHKEIMSIIQIELEKGGHTYGNLEHLIHELGKNVLCETISDFEDWLKTENFHLKFSIPRFIKLLVPSEKRSSILPYLEKWSQQKYCSRDLFLKIYKQIMAGCYSDGKDKEFVIKSKDLLSKLAMESGMEPLFFTKGEDDETLQCAKLINGLEFYFKDLDYDKIITHLDFFPYLKNVLTEKWILKKKEENNRTNLLLRVLEREFPNDSKIENILQTMGEAKNKQEHEWQKLRLTNHVYDFLYLRNIELNIRRLSDANLDVIAHFRSKLQNDVQVDDTISEINLLGLLAEHYELKLESPVGKRNIDSLIEIDGQKLYLEIINPAEFAPVELFEGEVFTIPNRVKNKILDKCERQFSEIKDNIPVILAIDIHNTDIDSDSIEDSLYGSAQYTFLMDKETGKDQGGYWSRKDNSIHKSKSSSDVLSAVLCYKSELLTDMNFHITGKLIHNPHAKDHLIEHLSKRIEEIIFQIN